MRVALPGGPPAPTVMDRRAFLGRAASRVPAPTPVPAHASLAATLAPYAGPWTLREAAHLVRRTHVGGARADVVGALTRGSATSAVNAMISAALARPLPDTPSWASTLTTDDGQNTDRMYQWQRGWYAEMSAGALREKMTLFWHDHFATGHGVYRHAAFSVHYLTFLRENAVGPFRPLLLGIGKTPAMLRFLNNELNRDGQINENYAREILELFSVGLVGPDGQPTYTQSDVREAARALTGWVINETTIRGEFRPARHDAGQKTVFGQTGAWDHDDVVDLILAQRPAAVAHFLATKLYAWFVHPVPNAGVVAELASVLRATDFDVPAALRALLTSAHFYDAAVVGARLTTPFELTLGLLRELGLPLSTAVGEHVRELTNTLGQEVLNPPSVEGWVGYDDPLEYRAWVTTGTLPERRGFADGAVGGGAVFAAFDALPLVDQISDRTQPYTIARDLSAHLLAPPLSEAETDALADATLLDGAPDTYTRAQRISFWAEVMILSPGTARARLRALLTAIVNLPEYQLV